MEEVLFMGRKPSNTENYKRRSSHHHHDVYSSAAMGSSSTSKASLLILIASLLLLLSSSSSSVTAMSSGTSSARAQHPRTTKDDIITAKLYLRKLHEATVHTIQSPDQDIIHCVPREKQPAFDHPLLQGHTLQETPSFIPVSSSEKETSTRNITSRNDNNSSLFGTQLWHHHGRCPQGTIPIRRPSLSNIIHSHHSRRHRRSTLRISTHDSPFNSMLSGSIQHHEYASAQYDLMPVYGASAIFSAWRPQVTVQSDMSIEQLWLITGNFTDTYLDTIEAGWTVEPLAYGDTNTRFFIFWTNDFYHLNGCLDLWCPGFVQVSSEMVLGGTLNPISTYQGSQYEMQPVVVWKDVTTGNWWLRIGKTNIGYWPSSLFKNGLQEKATIVQWGGEIINSSPGGHHTDTHMGSGHFGSEGFGKAAYVRSISMVDASNTLSPVPMHHLSISSTNPTCYDVAPAENDAWGSAFFFGGPGYSQSCP